MGPAHVNSGVSHSRHVSVVLTLCGTQRADDGTIRAEDIGGIPGVAADDGRSPLPADITCFGVPRCFTGSIEA